MVQLAIEIGMDNVRAVIKKGGEYNIVPLGLIGTPFSCPPICLRTGGDYVFGEAARLNAVFRPDEIVFLSDYTRKGSVDKKVLVAFIRYICQKVEIIFNERVKDILFVVPPYINNACIQRLLDECIRESGHVSLPTLDSTLSFAKSNFNVARGESVCVIDMRDCPSYVAVVSRTDHSYSTLGSIELADLSIKDCENVIEEKITANSPANIKMDASENGISEWMQSEISTILSRYGLTNLIAGNDACIPLPFSSNDCKIQQTAFQDWIALGIDKVWSQILSLFINIRISAMQVNKVVMLGSLFRSEFIWGRFKKCFIGYGGNPEISILSKPNDEWAMCLSSLKANIQSSDCALIF